MVETTSASNPKKPASTELNYTIGAEDLPLSCPTRHMEVWNAHPRVFLPIEETGKATCPYCGAHFTLKNSNGND